jgi:spermidine synthase
MFWYWLIDLQIYAMFYTLAGSWISIIVSEGFLAFYSVNNVVTNAVTNYQEVFVVETTQFGKSLVIN